MFGCLRGIFVLLNVLGGFFVSFENVSNLDWSGQKLEDMEYPSFHKKKDSSRRFVFTPRFSGDRFFVHNNRNILVIKCEKHSFRKSWVS